MPPRWTVEPTDKQFAQGSDAKVDCKADGFPKPKISWKKAAGKFCLTAGFFFSYEENYLMISFLLVKNYSSLKILFFDERFSFMNLRWIMLNCFQH